MAFSMPPRFRGSALFGAVIATLAMVAQPALALDFLGWFGLGEKPPAPSATTITYEVQFPGVTDKDLLQALRDASTLYRLRQDPLPDAESLLRRSQVDLPHLTSALWGAGYYDGTVSIAVGGMPLGPDGTDARILRRIEAYRGVAAVPISVITNPGPLFSIGRVVVNDARTNAPFAPEVLPQRVIKLRPGDPARSALVVAAEVRIIDHFRNVGHPFAKLAHLDPVVDHRSKTMSLAFSIDPGPVAGIGSVTVRGTERVDPAVVRSFIYTQPGDPYSPRALADIRKSVGRIEALGSVRVREAEALDSAGNLPLFVDVTERPLRVVGFGLRYSTIDGPGGRVYWAHRNLFGGAESLRIEGDLYYVDRQRFFETRPEKDFDWGNLGGRLSANFLKPALWGSRNDLLINGFGAREVTDSYTSRAVGATIALRHRFSDTFSIQGGLEAERGEATDSIGRVDYTLIGLPLSVLYDSTDNPLDPTRGWKITGAVAPYPEFFGSDPGMLVTRASASTYFAFDEEARYILAGRVGFGSIVGPDLDEIPANRRFYAGGGGSVRGYEYQSLSPLGPFGEPIGGRSLLEGSIEARVKVTDVIGIVPFIDAGTAFESSYPDFDERIRFSAGLGLRYYTGIGPIRVDVAFPLDRRRGDSAAALYISLGQSF
jgi:translocation and assembly module TamA